MAYCKTCGSNEHWTLYCDKVAHQVPNVAEKVAHVKELVAHVANKSSTREESKQERWRKKNWEKYASSRREYMKAYRKRVKG